MIDVQEGWVNGAHGRLYVKRWRPTGRRSDHLPPIVLFHDSLGCVALWREFPDRLAAATQMEVIAYDRLGFGQSDPHPGRLSPLHFIHGEADEGFEFLRDALKLDRFVAFGHSVGGGMAVGCAAVHPELCQALITESAQVFPEDLTLQGIREAKQMFLEPEQMHRLAKYHGKKAPWVLSAWVDSWLAPEFCAWSLDEDLRRVHCPVLAIHGDRDEYGSVSHPRRIAEHAGGPSTTFILEDCGHVPHREKEAQILTKIGQWLGSVLQ